MPDDNLFKVRKVQPRDYSGAEFVVEVDPREVEKTIKLMFTRGSDTRHLSGRLPEFKLVEARIDGHSFITIPYDGSTERPSCNHIPTIEAMRDFDRREEIAREALERAKDREVEARRALGDATTARLDAEMALKRVQS